MNKLKIAGIANGEKRYIVATLVNNEWIQYHGQIYSNFESADTQAQIIAKINNFEYINMR